MNNPTDFLGRPIKVNHILVYPVRHGSKMWLNKIKVTKVETDRIYGTNKDCRMVQLTNLHNTIIIRPGSITPKITL